MNIIRSKAVELTSIPAIAYKQKLKAGGAGIRILRLDTDASAVAAIDKRTGEAAPYSAFNEDLFPLEAFEEALELTLGMPYSARGKIVVKTFETAAEAEDVEQTSAEPEACILDSAEYKAIVERYLDEKGKINYILMNKDFIQFASKSTVVSKMLGDMASVEDITLFVVKNRAAFIAGEKEQLSDDDTKRLIEALDEIDPRSAFKELKAHIKRMLARAKNN